MNIIGTAVLVGRLASLGLAADKALTLGQTVIGLMHDAEALAKEVAAAPKTPEGIAATLAGSEKLAAVKDGAWGVAQTLKLDDDFERLWAGIKPTINLLVRVYRAIGVFAK